MSKPDTPYRKRALGDRALLGSGLGRGLLGDAILIRARIQVRLQV